MSPILTVTNLTKKYPGKWSWQKLTKSPSVTAVKNISFKVSPGEIVGLLGPNGAGKSTTIQMLLSTTTPTSGQINYFDLNFRTHRSEILNQVNYASAYTRFPWHMTVYENLMVYALMYQVKNPDSRIKKLLDQFDMLPYLNSTMRELSAGQTTRVILAKAFINYPKLILLDEPTASLDPESAANVRKFLLKQQQEYDVAMLFTSHNMAEVTEVCDRVIFINHGKIVAENSPQDLARQMRDVIIRFRLEDRPKLSLHDSDISSWKHNPETHELVITAKEEAIAHVLELVAKEKLHYSQIHIDKPSLEDYFIHQANINDQKP